MESIEDDKKKNIELIQVAIHQLLEEKKKNNNNKKGKEEEGEEEEEEDLILSKLLSQLDSLEKDAHNTYLPKCPAEKHEPSMSASKAAEVGLDEVMRELKKVKRQNLITHCLLSVMIVVTAVWQFSEASMLISMKQKISHPMQSVGDMITGTLNGHGKKHKIETPGLPQLPSVELSSFSLNGNEEDRIL